MKLTTVAAMALVFAAATVQAAAPLTPNPEAAGHDDVTKFDDPKDASSGDRIAGGGGGGHRCHRDYDCRHGGHCYHGWCRGGDGYCHRDYDCGHGRHCHKGRCH